MNFIMTSKELFRRLQAFSVLNLASQLFYSGDLPKSFIFRVQFSWHGRKQENFVSVPSVSCFGEIFISDCDYFYFDRFTIDQFQSQVKYFISFYNRCSKRQQEIVRSSNLVTDLLSFLHDSSE